MTVTAEKPVIEMLPFASITTSPLNPRKHFDLAKLADLAESIAAKGVLQNLVVRPSGNAFEIAAGERRWRAVQLLIENGRLEPTFLLPATVLDLTDVELLEIAMAENVRRQGMHPLEEADGYLAMVKLGETPESIATRTGAAESSVEKRVRLAETLCKSGRKLLLKGEITLAQAQALTIVPVKVQEAYIKDSAQRYYGGGLPDPRSIKSNLSVKNPPVSRAFFKLKQYFDKGGVVVPNVYDDDDPGYFADAELYRTLQLEAVEERKAALEKKGQTVHVVHQNYLSYNDWTNREGHTVLLVNPGTFAVEVNKNQGPREKVSSGSVKSDVPKAPARNKKRMVFEDQALTRAVQNGVVESRKLSLIVAILGVFTSTGTRYSHGYHYQTYKDGGYHNEDVNRTTHALRASVAAALGEKALPYADAADLLSGPSLGYGNDKRVRKVLDWLGTLDEETLEVYFRALTAAHISAIFEGEHTELHAWLLEQTKPDMHDYFKADASYLATCSKAELEKIAPQLGGAISGNQKKPDIVAGLAAKPAITTWLPERLRIGGEK